MPRGNVTLRMATVADAEAIVALCSAFGYEMDRAAIANRIVQSGTERAVVVAIDGRDIVGVLAVTVRDAFISGHRGEVEALVVRKEYHGFNVGATLLTFAERWAAAKASDTLQLFTNVFREPKGGFYLSSTYAVSKNEQLLRKSL